MTGEVVRVWPCEVCGKALQLPLSFAANLKLF